jgi:hypothetical protein
MTDALIETLPPFTEFASIARLTRDIIVTEKIDGANAQIHITEDGRVIAGSRNRWVPLDGKQSHFGFEKWVAEHTDELRLLGPGSHYGEWWGSGIQRRYGLDEKRLSLFNVGRWHSDYNESIHSDEGPGSTRCHEVPCCHVVPVLSRWTFDTWHIDNTLKQLAESGSAAAPGFMQPEGIVIYHAASKTLFKKTLDKNDGHKSAPEAPHA